MGERKVINKYFPPDFDPEKLLSRGQLAKQQSTTKKRGPRQMNVRMMFPFTLCCSGCNEFTYIGTKFNSRVEKVQDMDYLGIAIWRFYGRCPNCRAEIIFRTDPKTTDYILESGGVRTYDSRRDAELAETTLKGQLKEELETDAMKALEHKTYNTATELVTLEQLDELRKMNKRLLNRDTTLNSAIDWLRDTTTATQNELTEADMKDLESAKEEMFESRFLSREKSDSEEDDKEKEGSGAKVAAEGGPSTEPTSEGRDKKEAEEKTQVDDNAPNARPRRQLRATSSSTSTGSVRATFRPTFIVKRKVETPAATPPVVKKPRGSDNTDG